MKTILTACRTGVVVLVAGLALLAALPAGAVSIIEPATVFYGTVTGTGSAQPFSLTEGTIEWTLRRPDGVDVVLTTVIFPLNGGAISYHLEVPHEAWGLGLVGSTSSIPLSASMATNISVRITVNGVTARIVPPASDVFAADQISRAATYRMDLEVPLVAADSDGDGMPDWWEALYGFDLQNPADAALDSDGDGISNLQEYLAGTDPRRDDRIPELRAATLRAYTGGSTGVRLSPRDVDTPSSALIYTVQACPDEGRLLLRNAITGGTNSDVTVVVGATFTQADVDSGRLVYVCSATNPASSETRFEVRLQDENLAHPAAQAVMTLAFYSPPSGTEIPDCSSVAAGMPPRLPLLSGLAMDEALRLETWCLGRTPGLIAWDASSESRAVRMVVPSSGLTLAAYTNAYVSLFGRDRQNVLWGGNGSDHLSGGMESDVLIGGRGNDILRGNGGADLFVITDAMDGNDVIEDFSVSGHDVLDLSRLLTGTPGWLTNYVHLTVSGTNTLVGINLSGAGVGFTNMVVTLAGISLGQESLGTLVENGNLLCGDSKVMVPRVSISASIPAASENGPVNGEFTLSRGGGTESDLAVNITISGSAANGVDYELISSLIVIPAGASSVAIPVVPYVDTSSELKEVVQINVAAGPGYEVGTTGTAQVTIEDLAPIVTIEALEPLAVKSTLESGLFLVSRGGILNRSVLVRLNIGGTAANGTDYSGVPTYVNFEAGQATALISVVPKAGATLANGAESVEVSIRPDTTYCVGSPSSAKVVIVDERLTLGEWRARSGTVSAADLLTFAQEDPGLMGIRNLQRYAFGLDAVDPQHSFGMPTYTLDHNQLSVTFRRPLSVTDVDYTPELSGNLNQWMSGSNYFEGFIHPDYTGRLDMVSYRVRQPLTNSLPIFMRVRLDYTP